MRYKVEFSEQVEIDIDRHIKFGNKKVSLKIDTLVEELSQNPRIGTGKPERLKGFEVETWSRRLDGRHRLVYEIRDDQLIVLAISAFGHYE